VLLKLGGSLLFSRLVEVLVGAGWLVLFFGYWSFSKALKILLVALLVSLFKWLLMENSFYIMYISTVSRWAHLPWYCKMQCLDIVTFNDSYYEVSLIYLV